ncbi:MAG: tetratricopeptide repeat protein [Bacteroidales bacterium]|nr:tetratricopeptide repeat protein [Bacteroidales bacterium]
MSKPKYKGKNDNNKAKNIATSATPMSEMPKAKAGIIPIIILAVVSLALYINALRNDYALDDSMVLIRNSFTQDGVSGIGDIFKYDTFTGFWVFNDSTHTVEQIVKEKKLLAGGRYRPLSLATFAIEIELFGKDFHDENGILVGQGCPAINHAMNAMYYALTVVLLYIILVRLFPRRDKSWWFSIPFIASLLFAFHPIHTEVVANIKGRDEILTLLGSLAALWWSIKYIDSKKMYYLILSGLALLCGLFSKENAIVFLALVPLTLYYFTNAKWKEIGKVMIPLAVASVTFLAVRGMVLGWEHSEQTKELMNDPFINMNFSERYGTIFVTLLMYIKLLFFPHPLTYDYYPWQIPKTELTDGLALLSLAIYIAMGIYAVYGMITKKDIASYSILFFLIPLAPVCNIFFAVGTLMNERFVFISSIGFCLIVAWFFAEVLPKLLKNITMAKYITGVVGIIVLLLFSLKTVTRNADWENDTVLFTHDVEISSESAKGNCAAGGRTLERAQSKEVKDNDKELHDALCNKAIKYLKKSNEIYASDGKRNSKKHSSSAVYSDAMNLLGNAYFEIGDIANALDSYLNIIKAFPNHDIANSNIKVVLNQTPGMLRNKLTTSTVPELLNVIGELIKVKPDCGEAYHVLGVLYGRELGNIEASLQCFEKAETCDFEKTAAYYKDLGVAYGISGNYAKSIPVLEKAIELDPDDDLSYTNLGYTYMNLGDTQKGQEYIAMGESLKQKKAENDKE